MRLNTIIRSVVSAALISAVLGGSADVQASTHKIGILIWANESRYETAANAFMEQMKQEGFAAPDVEYVIRKAGGNKASAMIMADELAAQKLDLYYALGTSGTKAITRVVKNTPVVFSVVYDPVEAGFVQGWDSSMNNVTGIANFLPMSKVLDLARRVIPIKSMVVLYTPNEKNTESQLKDLQQCSADFGVTIIPMAIVDGSELATALPFLIGKVQAIFVTGSIVISKALPEVLSFAAKEKILTVTHLEDLVERGVMVGLSADSQEQGSRAGMLAVRILNGASPKNLPVEKGTVFSVLINKKSVQAAGITVPQEILQTAKRVIE